MFTLIPVILAGGEGRRLWPLSSAECPKQFLRFSANGESMFASAYRRALRLAPSRNIVVVTSKEHANLAWQEIRTVEKTSKAQALLEPCRRNTAAAVTLAAIHALNYFSNPILWVMPSDHTIGKPFALSNAVQESVMAADQGKIVTFGITPTRMDPNYGHIIPGASINHKDMYAVKMFLEKPQGQRLEWLMQQGCMWNSGMYMFSASTILKHIKTRGKLVTDGAYRAYQAARATKYGLLADKSYMGLPSFSIDKLVMENNDNLVVKPVDIGWADVGTWQSLWELSQSVAFAGQPLQKFLMQIGRAA